MPKHANADQYVADCAPPVAALLTKLRSFVHTRLPGTTEGMSYGVPVFLNAHGVPVIYIFGAPDHANFGFLKFDQMDDPDGVLIGSGKPSKHVEIHPGDPIETKVLQGFVDQCADIKPG